jgi:pimeloyl-ACP methyl ester carboxylesterase
MFATYYVHGAKVLQAFILIGVLVLFCGLQRVSGQPMKHGNAQVNGTSIYYEIKGDGFPLVLISGGGILDRRGWDDQFEKFSASYSVIRYDVRGLGKSARPTGAFSHSKDLHALLKYLKIEKTAVVGLSVGGAIAIDFTLEYPQMVDHLVLAAAGLSDDAKAEANLQALASVAGIAKKEGIDRVIQLTINAPFVISNKNQVGQDVVRKIYQDNADVFQSDFPVYRLWETTKPAASQRLSEIRCPVLVIRGDNDSPAYAALTSRIAKGITTAREVVITGGTHFLNLEKPAEFNRAVLEFLTKGRPLH